MVKAIKYSLLVFLLLIVLLLIIPFFIPAKYYQQAVLEWIRSRYGFNVEVEKVSLSFLPKPGVSLTHIKVSRSDGAKSLFEADKVTAVSQWIPLFQKQIILDEVTMQQGKDVALILTNLEKKEDDVSGHFDLRYKGSGAVGNLKYDVGHKSFWTQLHFSGVDLAKWVPVQKGRRVSGLLDGDVEASGTIEKIKSDLQIKSKNFSATVPGKVEMRNEALGISAHVEKNAEDWNLKTSKLEIGSQIAELEAHGTLGGALEAALTMSSLDTDYWSQQLTALKDFKDLKPVSLDLFFSGRPDALQTKGHLESKLFVWSEKKLENLKIDFTHRDGMLKVSSLTASYLDGLLVGNAELDLADQTMPLSYDIDLKNIDVSQMEDAGRMLKGRGNLSVKGTVQASSAAAIKNTLTNSGSFAVSNLEIAGLKAFSKLADNDIWNLLGSFPTVKKGLARMKNLDSQLRDLSSRFAIRNGKLNLSSVEISSKLSSLLLSGTVSIAKELDLSGSLKIPASTLKNIIKQPKIEAALLSKGVLEIPLTISGTFSSPIVTPDLSILQKKIMGVIGNEIKIKVKDKIEDKIKDQIDDKVKDRLRDKIDDAIETINS